MSKQDHGWKTVRAIVEVSVRGNYTEKNFCYDLRVAVERTPLPLMQVNTLDVGKFRYKSWRRVLPTLLRRLSLGV